MSVTSAPSKKKSSGASQYYPPVGFHFEVKIKGSNSVDASFQEVSGISVEIPTEDFFEGGENRFTYKLPKPIKYSPLQLKRGLVSSSSAFADWCTNTFKSGFDQPVETKNVVVNLLDEEKTPLMSWTFIDAFPTKWNLSNFNAQSNDIVVESLELTYKRFELNH